MAQQLFGGTGNPMALILQLLMQGSDQGPPTVQQAYGGKPSPLKQAQATADKYLEMAGGEAGGEEQPKDKMTVADAFGLMDAGASASAAMRPPMPSPPSLPGGRFSQIDPTTLLFMQSLMRGR